MKKGLMMIAACMTAFSLAACATTKCAGNHNNPGADCSGGRGETAKGWQLHFVHDVLRSPGLPGHSDRDGKRG